MRDEISHGVIDAEFLEYALGFFFLELVIYAYILGISNPSIGGVFFIVVLLSLWTSKILSSLILMGFTYQTTHLAYTIIESSYQDTTTIYVFTAIAFIFISTPHLNTYFY